MPQQQAPAVDPTAGAGAFGDFDAAGDGLNLDFSALDNANVLEHFDFDSFLQNTEDGNNGFLHNTEDGSNGFSFDPVINFSEGLETSGME